MQEDDVSLGTLLERSLSQADELLESSPIDQPKLHTLLANLELCDRMTSHLGVISTNEELQDISTRSLNCFHVPFYRGMLSLQIKSTGTVIRQQHLSLALEHFNAYVERIKHHRILEPLPDILSASSQSIDQATRRNNKIRMYRKEKELKQSLAQAKARSQSTQGEDSDHDEALRKAIVLQLELEFLKAHTEIDSAEFELQLLRASIPMSDLPHGDPSSQSNKLEDTSWRLDRAQPAQKSWFDPQAGPVLSEGGKILRPFTITGASASLEDRLATRLTLKDQVFGPSHRLPTMTIDEFLQKEYDAGRVLQGGEADAQRQDAESRARKELVEMDNLEGYQAGEDRLAEERRQDDYRDTHRRGDGNRIGRG